MIRYLGKFICSTGLVAGLVVGCGGSNAEDVSVRLGGAVDRPAQLTPSMLQKQAAVTQTVTFNSGTTPQTHTYTGAATWSILEGAGIQLDATRKNDILDRYLLATGGDGYRVVFSLGELNPDFGNRQGVVAYSETIGVTKTLLDADSGPFRITAPGDVKGGRYVSGLAALDVRASASVPAAGASGGGTSASVAVSGAVVRPGSFDVAALRALPASTQTIGGSVYTGVDLWTLLNAAAGLQTEAGLKNPTLAMYATATGTDGYKALVALGEIDPGFGNRTTLVAYAVNGAALGATGALRLVVSGDARLGRSVSNLKSIEVFVAPAR